MDDRYEGNGPEEREKGEKINVEAQGATEELEEIALDYSGFQIVRREFFAHLQEPSIVFNQGKFSVNTACIRKMPEIDFIQILVNREKRMLVIRPCEESEVHSFQWCTSRNGKKMPRFVTGKIFYLKICDMMEWDPENRYKVMGKLVKSQGQILFVFDLTAVEMYQRIQRDGQKAKASRTPMFRADWKDQFGIPFEDREKVLRINTFDGYAVYEVCPQRKEQEMQMLPPPMPGYTATMPILG